MRYVEAFNLFKCVEAKNNFIYFLFSQKCAIKWFEKQNVDYKRKLKKKLKVTQKLNDIIDAAARLGWIRRLRGEREKTCLHKTLNKKE